MTTVEEEIDSLPTVEAGLTLRTLVIVVRKFQIHASAVNVHVLA